MSNIAKGIYVFYLDGELFGYFRTQLEAKSAMGAPTREALTWYANTGAPFRKKWRVSFTDAPLSIPQKNTSAKKTFLYTREGGFIGEFKSRGEAIRSAGLKSGSPTKVFLSDSPDGHVFEPLKKARYKNIILYSNQGKPSMAFANTSAICEHFEISNQMACAAIRSGARIRGEWTAYEDIQNDLDYGSDIKVREGVPVSFDVPVGYCFDYFVQASRFTGLTVNRLKQLVEYGRFFRHKFKVEMDGDKIIVWVKSK